MAKKNKLNIAHLHWGFPPIIGGVETHLTILLPQMAKLGHKVSLLTGAVEGLNGKYKYEGVDIYRTPLQSCMGLALSRKMAKKGHQVIGQGNVISLSAANNLARDS